MAGPKREKQVRLRFTEEEYREAQEYAAHNGISVSALIRWLVRRFVSDPYSLSKQDVEAIKAEENARPSRRKQ